MKEQRLVRITKDSSGFNFVIDLMDANAEYCLRDWYDIPEPLIVLLMDEHFVYGLEE